MLNANGLCWRLQLNSIEVKMKRSHLLKACLSLHEDSIAMQLDVTSDLEMIFLLADESVVRVREVEAFIGVDTKVRNWSEEE